MRLSLSAMTLVSIFTDSVRARYGNPSRKSSGMEARHGPMSRREEQGGADP